MHRTGIVLLAAAWALGGSLAFSQDLRENAGRSLFSDQKAVRVGDAVTILIVESSSATNDARTEASRSSNLTLNATGQTGDKAIPGVNLGVGTGNSFKGEGGTSASGSLRARISARIDSVLPNGNLLVHGNRKITINNEDQIIHISGVIRPSDIQADNSVYSYNISDAEIAFEGSGIVSRAQGPGWITKLLHFLF
jgi:flagellar L-ring protein FlgH